MPRLTILNLDDERLAEAYPLVRSRLGIPLERWLAFGRSVARLGGGVLGAQAQDGCLHGIATYRPVPSLLHERCLRIDAMIIFELKRDSGVREALHGALQRVARDVGCNVIQYRLEVGDSADLDTPQRARLEQLGCRLDEMLLSQDLAGPASVKEADRSR